MPQLEWHMSDPRSGTCQIPPASPGGGFLMSLRKVTSLSAGSSQGRIRAKKTWTRSIFHHFFHFFLPLELEAARLALSLLHR